MTESFVDCKSCNAEEASSSQFTLIEKYGGRPQRSKKYGIVFDAVLAEKQSNYQKTSKSFEGKPSGPPVRVEIPHDYTDSSFRTEPRFEAKEF